MSPQGQGWPDCARKWNRVKCKPAKDREFYRITCDNGLNANVAKFCRKGQLVTVEGRIRYTQWEDQSGTKRYGCEIIADKVDFLTNGRISSGESAPDIDED
ncbi:single-stranded DNA-binding protein [Novosphingobium sp.]|uniref:single-stranded DNA-binding protein n=1 Tax=Novosphingobium sp. TaxID=1874826 RepID=UPI002615B4EE|nr:single-stranded DNA-binding protein [Novosphingobium sp.]